MTDRAVAFDCVWRKGFLRPAVRGANNWQPRGAPNITKRNEAPFDAIRQFWSPILCRPPWRKSIFPDDYLGVLRDSCFACGFDTLFLDRAHILPRTLGGADGPENLHLLCRMCHELSEDLCGLDYWRWFRGQTLTRSVCYGATRRLAMLFGANDRKAVEPLQVRDLHVLARQYAIGRDGPLALELTLRPYLEGEDSTPIAVV